MIPYEEVEIRETQFDNGMTLSSGESFEERPVQDAHLILRKREYRTARHMALMET